MTAVSAYPYVDAGRAAAGLQGQLRELAATAGKRPDWSTLVVAGPSERTGAHGRSWFEWVATVEPIDRGATP